MAAILVSTESKWREEFGGDVLHSEDNGNHHF